MNEVGETLLAELRRHPEVRSWSAWSAKSRHRATPAAAARRMLEAFHGRATVPEARPPRCRSPEGALLKRKTPAQMTAE